MLSAFFDIFLIIFKFLGFALIPLGIVIILFTITVFVWIAIYRIKYKKVFPLNTNRLPKRENFFKMFFISIPRRFVLDRIERKPDTFEYKGIHMFCGEQGSGKTIAAVEMMMRLQYAYPKSKCITNLGYKYENKPLTKWEQLLTYNNDRFGVIVGIDEIQNWFMSGTNKLPEGMLEVVTQNRKNRRILCCTAQVFTRVNKGIREQVNMVYNPHTFLGCFTVVIKRKPEFDSEGNVTNMKYKGVYCFVHSDELREAYDTYKVIHRLAKEGFKDQPQQVVHNVTIKA